MDAPPRSTDLKVGDPGGLGDAANREALTPDGDLLAEEARPRRVRRAHVSKLEVRAVDRTGFTHRYLLLVAHVPRSRRCRSLEANITQIYEGTNQIQRVVMSRQLLKG